MLARRMQMAAAGASVATYAEILRDTYGASEIWPLVNISSGTTIPAFVNSARNGTLVGWDLQNAAGPVTGTLAPLSDGANDHGNIYSSNGTDGLADISDLDMCSVILFCRVSGAGVWTDGSNRFIYRLFNDGNDEMSVLKDAVSNKIEWRREDSSGTTIVAKNSVSTTDWFSVGWSVDVTAGEYKVFFDGQQEGSTQSAAAVTDTVLGSAANSIGSALGGSPNSVWDGFLAYLAVKFGSIWTPAEFAAIHAAAATAGAD